MLQFRIKHQIPQFKKIQEVSWNKVPAFENSWHVQLRNEGAMRNAGGGGKRHVFFPWKYQIYRTVGRRTI